MSRFDLSATLDGIEWMPGFDVLNDAPAVAPVFCGHRGCGRKAGYRVVVAPGGLEVLIGTRALSPALMAPDTREEAMARREARGRRAATWLGYVAIPLEGEEPGEPVVLTRAIRNALAGHDLRDLDRSWSAWLSATPAPRWATRLTAQCGKHDTMVDLADVYHRTSRPVTTRPLPPTS